MTRTYYDVLMLSPHADRELITVAYRHLAKRYHPDRDASSQAAARMAELNELLGQIEIADRPEAPASPPIAAYTYDGDDPLYDKERTDLELRTTAGVTHEYINDEDLLKDWIVNLFWERTHNNSNIGELYTYKRYQMMLMLSRAF